MPCSSCSWVQWAIQCFLLCFLSGSEHSLTHNHCVSENLLFGSTDLVCSSTITPPTLLLLLLPALFGRRILLFVEQTICCLQLQCICNLKTAKAQKLHSVFHTPTSLMLRSEELHRKQSSALQAHAVRAQLAALPARLGSNDCIQDKRPFPGFSVPCFANPKHSFPKSEPSRGFLITSSFFRSYFVFCFRKQIISSDTHTKSQQEGPGGAQHRKPNSQPHGSVDPAGVLLCSLNRDEPTRCKGKLCCSALH